MKKCDRREALTKLAGIGAGAAGLALCAGCPGGSTYGEPREPGTDAAKMKNVEFDRRSIQPYSAREIQVGGRAAYLYRGGEQEEVWHAVDARCTHSGCKVGFNPETREYVCPCHGSRFAFDGARISGPARRPLKRYEVLVTAENVAVIPDRTELEGRPG